MSIKSSIAYTQSTDAAAREELSAKLHELGECYAKLANLAMAREDRHGVYECVAREREAHNRAFRVEKGYVRF